MGGRAADRIVYGQSYAGAESDLKQATRIARLMVSHWGMSNRIGPVAYRVGEEHVFLGKEIQEPRDFSEGTAQLIDEEVRRLLQEAVWLRDVSYLAAGAETEELARATALFDWTVQHIQLETRDGLHGQWRRPWQSLMFGKGTAEDH